MEPLIGAKVVKIEYGWNAISKFSRALALAIG
jgi:hypothetical protein